MLNVVTGGGEAVGNRLVADDRVVGISFTGSNAVGTEHAEIAASRGAKIQLEMGGKNPAIVLADADQEQALQHVINGAMMSTGQKCTATSRAIVERSLAGQFTDLLVRADRRPEGRRPAGAETQIGPLIDDRRRRTGSAKVPPPSKRAASCWCGGGARTMARGAGAFVSPALFADVDPDSRLGQEELFGPVLGVIPVDGIDEAIAVANRVRFGLSASLFTRDLGKALTFVQGIQAGIVHVNSETAGAEPQVPFGGMKGSSSYSREQGKAARDFYTQIKTVYIDPPAS